MRRLRTGAAGAGPDTLGLAEAGAAPLAAQPLDLLVSDCSEPPQPEPEPEPCNHNDLPRALAIVARLRPAETVPTHIGGHNLDAWLMEHPAALPAGGRAL